MITFMESKERSKESEKCLDSELWHACAGSMVQMPAVNSKVLYFPQGHLEHVCGSNLDFGNCPRLPAYVPCRVCAVKLMADPETDEVFAKMRLVPVAGDEVDGSKDSSVVEVHGGANEEKPSSFAKTLTQSDANNGGGFSVPRYCAETIFPRLDYSADPPVETILVKDVHGTVWKFRHIYRGTPRRHLLTTGWSTFVNQKKLVAGDSVVFVRAGNGDLCVGVRRAAAKSEAVAHSQWNPGYGGFWSMMSSSSSSSSSSRGGVQGEDVIECASLAANGKAFDVVYYPRNGNSEFCVKACVVKAALGIRWCSGMRFKMAFETQDSWRITWFMGTISSVQVADSLRWPDSPWRLLQVRWDEPDLLPNVKRVNPWSVELVSNIPHKRLRLEFPGKHHLVGGMQGARHGQYGITLSHLHFTRQASNSTSIANHTNIPRMGASPKSESAPPLVLFGRQILTEHQISMTCNAGVGNTTSSGPCSALNHNDTHEPSPTAHCKVFMESDDVGRTIDLSLLASYTELLQKLATMFHLQADEISNHVLYRDTKGALRQLGEEPFSKFTKSATRLRVVANSK